MRWVYSRNPPSRLLLRYDHTGSDDEIAAYYRDMRIMRLAYDAAREEIRWRRANI